MHFVCERQECTIKTNSYNDVHRIVSPRMKWPEVIVVRGNDMIYSYKFFEHSQLSGN